MQWFRGGLVFKAHRLLYHSTQAPKLALEGLEVFQYEPDKDFAGYAVGQVSTLIS